MTIVRVKRVHYLRGRRLDPHGMHAGLVQLQTADAAALIDLGIAKRPGGDRTRSPEAQRRRAEAREARIANQPAA